jgi:O-antigen/teichoic acid export membrane protein
MGNWFRVGSTTLLVLALNLISGVILSRWLEPEGRGLLAAILFWPHFLAGVLGLSLNEATTHAVASAQSQLAGREILGTGLALSFLIAVAIVLCCTPLLPWLLGLERGDILDITTLYLALFVPLSLCHQLLLAWEVGRMRFDRHQLMMLAQPAIYALGIAMLLVLDLLNPRSAAIAALSSVAIAASAALWVSIDNGLTFSFPRARMLTGTGMRFHVINLSIFAAAEIDRLVVLQWMSNADLGLYVSAMGIASIAGSLIGQTTNTVLFPLVAQQSNSKGMAVVLSHVLQRTTLLAVITAVVIVGVMPWLLPAAYGELFEPAILPSQILVGAYAIKVVRQVSEKGLRAAGYIRPGVLGEFGTLGTFVVVAYLLHGSLKLEGIAIAVVVGQLVGLGATAFYLHKTYCLAPTAWWGFRYRVLKEIVDTLFYRIKRSHEER